jgi:DNA-binding FadR family transcriptional regulator
MPGRGPRRHSLPPGPRSPRVPGIIEATLAEHQAVFTAIQQGDPDSAETAMATLMTAADHRVRRSR